MPTFEGFDDEFDDVGNEESVKRFITEQRRIQRELSQQIKRLQESVNSGKLKGKTEFKPFNEPGISGFIFRGTFEAPEIGDENSLPESNEKEIEDRNNFVLPETSETPYQEPVIESFLDGNEFVALVELPGVDESEIKIETGDTWVKVRATGYRTTTIDTPSNAELRKLDKKYKNGVLEIRIPVGNNVSGQKDFGYRIV
jgi:HSP20 family molecular chaperone IbpA